MQCLLLHRIKYFADFLHHYAHYRLPSRTTMAEYIPLILQREVVAVREAVGDDYISIMLDGMTRLGELFVILVRFVTVDLQLVQKIISIRTMEKTLNAKQMAGEMVNELTTQLGITGPSLRRLVCASHDRCNTNKAALRELVCRKGPISLFWVCAKLISVRVCAFVYWHAWQMA
jgi:hypothetical protein